MKLLKTVGVIIFSMQLGAVALADPHGMQGGGGGGFGHGQNFQGSGSLPASHPPGLQSMPHGLAKQNKIPAGWSHGVKKGWNCSVGGNGQTCTTPKGNTCTRASKRGHFSCN